MLQRMPQIGRRTAELHRASRKLSPVSEGFAPEPISQEDSGRWSEAIMSRATHVSRCSETQTGSASRLEPRAKAEGSPRSDLFAH